MNIPINYEFFRCDQPNDSGQGGCGILVSKRLNYKEYKIDLTYTDINKIEAVWIELLDQNILVCSFYRSNNFTPLDVFLDYIFECMIKLSGRKVLWIGDVD